MKPPPQSVDKTLGSTVLHALKWRYAGAVVQGGLQFGIGVVLARLLSPEAFGIVGIALIATGFGKLVGDFGFGTAIIQYPAVTQRHVRAALTGTTLISLLVFAVLWFLAPAISHLFDQDGLTTMLRVIGISLVFSGMSITVVSVLRRELRFQILTTIESVSYIVGFGGVGISTAMLGYGAWSLVAANIVQPFCLLGLGLYFIKKPLWPYFGVQEYRDLFRVASAEAFNNVVSYAGTSLQFILVGKWLGTTALGLYNRSFNLMDLPIRYFSVALSSVMFPVYARLQGDIPRLGSGFLRTFSFTALVTIPVFFSIGAVPNIVIGGLFGEQWKPAAGAFQLLCLSGPFIAMIRVFVAVSHARGCVFNESARQVVYIIFMVGALWFLLPFGIEGAALAFATATFARYLLLAHLSLKLVAVGWKQFFFAQMPAYLLAMVTSASAYLAGIAGEMLRMPDTLQLLMVIPACGVSLILALFLFPASWFGDLYPWIIERFGKQIRGRVGKFLMLKVSVS